MQSPNATNRDSRDPRGRNKTMMDGMKPIKAPANSNARLRLSSSLTNSHPILVGSGVIVASNSSNINLVAFISSGLLSLPHLGEYMHAGQRSSHLQSLTSSHPLYHHINNIRNEKNYRVFALLAF